MSDGVVLKTSISEEGSQHLVLEMIVGGEPQAHARLWGGEIENFIHQIGNTRAKLSDTVPLDIDPGSRISTVIDPVWRAKEVPDGAVLALRHPGLGWLGFHFDPKEMTALGKWLIDRSAERKS